MGNEEGAAFEGAQVLGEGRAGQRIRVHEPPYHEHAGQAFRLLGNGAHEHGGRLGDHLQSSRRYVSFRRWPLLVVSSAAVLTIAPTA